jgi:hypothetical protein
MANGCKSYRTSYQFGGFFVLELIGRIVEEEGGKKKDPY